MFETIIKCLEIWKSGGWVMVPLFLLAVLIYTNGIALLLFLSKGNIQLGREDQWNKWVSHPELATGRIGEIIRYTQENVSAGKHIQNRFEEIRKSMLENIERRLTFLNTLTTAAPLLGLLGTVIGISEALITTQTGLFIALPGIFLILVIRRRKQAIESALSRIESISLTQLKLD